MADELALLSAEVLNLLETHVNSQNISANESQTERHIHNSKPNSPIDLEPGLREGRADDFGLNGFRTERSPKVRKRVIEAMRHGSAQRSKPILSGWCSKLAPTSPITPRSGIDSWRDLIATAGLARAALGISADAWREAQETMGAGDAAVIIAAILQKGEAISSPGGYLRALSAKARAKEFSDRSGVDGAVAWQVG